MDASSIIDGNALFTHFKGAIAEQYVCQQLVSDCGLEPYYWSAAKSTGKADFMVQVGGLIVPIEVKAEENLKAKSLASFCKTHNIKHAVRASLSGYRQESWLTNVPLYAISCLPSLSFFAS